MPLERKRFDWFKPWKKIFVINLIFLGTLAFLALLYALLFPLCYKYIGTVCREFIGPPLGF